MTPKVALITGAGRRIGAALARFLHARGMNIVIHYHQSKADAQALEHALNQQRVNSAATVCLDLNATDHLPALVAKAQAVWSRLDVLINNASTFYPTEIGKTTVEQWENLISPNLKAPYFLAQAAVPFLAEHQGSIINITDIHADKPLADYPVYSITKAGLVMLTKALAKELGPAVRVNAVSPGVILWPEADSELKDDLKGHIVERVTMKRKGEPEDIAKAVWFLLNDGSYITGQIIAVDGGRSLQM